MIYSTEQPDSNQGQKHSELLVLPAMLLVTAVILAAVWFATTLALSTQNYDPILELKIKVLSITITLFSISIAIMARKSDIPEDPYDPVRETWFGHRMAREGEWTNIPVVLVAMYSLVLGYGTVVSIITGPDTPLLCIPAFYMVGLVAFYFWHVAAHRLDNTELNRVHMLHHQDRFPQHDFYGDSIPDMQRERDARGGGPQTMLSLMNPFRRAAEPTSLAHEGPLVLAVLAVVVFAKLLLHVSTATCLWALLGFLLLMSVGSAIHMSFHERGFQLEPYAWFRELRALHMIHHLHRKNFAMVNVILDMMFCSLLLRE